MPKYATTRIDWKNRDFKVIGGMEGDAPDLPFGVVLGFVAESEGPDVERWATVYWDDVSQLCHYSLDELMSECLQHEEEEMELHIPLAIAQLSSGSYVDLFLALYTEDPEYGLICLDSRTFNEEESLLLLDSVYDDDGRVVVRLMEGLSPEKLAEWLTRERVADLLEHPAQAVRLTVQRLWSRMEAERSDLNRKEGEGVATIETDAERREKEDRREGRRGRGS